MIEQAKRIAAISWAAWMSTTAHAQVIAPPINPLCLINGQIVHCTPQAEAIPTLGEWGGIVLVVLIVLVAWKYWRKK